MKASEHFGGGWCNSCLYSLRAQQSDSARHNAVPGLQWSCSRSGRNIRYVEVSPWDLEISQSGHSQLPSASTAQHRGSCMHTPAVMDVVCNGTL